MTSIFRKLSAVVLVPLALCLLLVSQTSQAATYITASITITNIPGVGSNWVVNGNSRTWTNTAGTPAASWIVTGASIAASATNLYNHMAAYPYSSPFLIIGRSSPTNFTIFGTSVTVTTNNYSSVSYVTNSGTNLMVVQVPFENVVGATNRTNQAHWLVDGLNRFPYTNSFTTNANVTSNFITKGASPKQEIISPLFVRGTLSVSNGFFSTNGFTSSLTNINPVTSNLVNYGSAIRSEGSGGNSLQVGSNAVASGTRSVAIGNGSVSSGTDAIGIGTSVISTNTDATIIGNGAQSLGISSVAVGKLSSARESGTSLGASSFSGTNATAAGVNANAGGYASTALGENSSASSYASVSIGSASIADAHGAAALGFQANSSYSNSVALGPTDHLGNTTSSTTTNQIRLGTANHTVSIPGQLLISGTQSNTVFKGTNIAGGAWAYPRFDLSTLANGNNISVPIGTNSFVRLSGTLTAVASICGMIGASTSGGNDGQSVVIYNDTGYTVTFAVNTVDPVAANRISTYGNADVAIPNQGWVRVVYDGNASRWKVTGAYPTTVTTVSSGASTNLAVYTDGTQAALTIWSQTGLVGQNHIQVMSTNGQVLHGVTSNGVAFFMPEAGRTNDSFQWMATNGTPVAFVNSNGTLNLIPRTGFVADAITLLSTNNQVVGGVNSNGVSYVQALTGSTNDLFQWRSTNGVVISEMRSNHTFVASNINVTPFGSEVGVGYRMFAITNLNIITNVIVDTSIISNVMGTVTFPANFWTPGMTFQFRSVGQIHTPASPLNFTNTVKLGSVTIGTNHFALPTSLANNFLRWDITIQCLSVGAAGSFVVWGGIETPSGAASGVLNRRDLFMTSPGTPVSVDTTAAQLFDLRMHPGATTQSYSIRSATGIIIP